MSWSYVRFGSLYQIDSRNGVSKPSRVRGAGFKMINMGELFSNDRIYDIPMELVPLSEKEKENYRVNNNDLLFARQSLVLEGAGKCSIVLGVSPLTVFESHLIRVRLNTELANPLFYYYFFRTPFSPIKTIVSQCAQAGIRASELKELSVPIPSKEQQDEIANCLNKYDLLIENNLQKIRDLETLSRKYYSYLLDKAGAYEKDANVICETLPKGWKIINLSDFTRIQFGFAFDGSLFNTKREGTPILRIRNVPSAYSDDFTTETAPNNYLVHRGDIVVGMDGEFHINCWAGEEAYLVQRVCNITPLNDSYRGYLLQAIHSPIKYFEKTLVGATVAHLGKKHLDTITIIAPTEDEVKVFNDMFYARCNLLRQNQLLSKLRDNVALSIFSREIDK